MTIGQLDDMEIIAEILTGRATRLKVSDAVEVFGNALAEGPISGRVARVYPAGFKKVNSLGVEQQRVKVAVKLDDRPDGLWVGFRVYVRIFHDEAEDVLVLPRTCLFRGDEGRWHIIVVRHGKARMVEVQVGLMNEQQAQIEGLSVYDQVVLRPSREIDPGMRVAVKGRD